MFVIKRDNTQELVHFDKITSRIQRLCYGLNSDFVDPIHISQKVCSGVYKGVTTSELDELAAETAAHLTSMHPDYGLLAARIAVSNLHKETLKGFSDTCKLLYNYVNPKTGQTAPMISDNVYAFIQKNKLQLNAAIVYDRDYSYDYFGFKTLERSYLLKINNKCVERPQHMLMRVAAGIHCGDLDSTIKTYELMSCKWFTHATPTLFNSGTPLPQLSSCFLLTAFDDSIEGIYDTLKATALISKSAGGIGMSVHNVRAQGSYIRGTNGNSNGLVPMLRVFNSTARYVDQGGGKRKGSFAIYLEPWHADIFAFLDLKKNHGSEEERCRDLFLGLWIPDLFMRRVEANEKFSLFCPNEAPGLADCHGQAFDELYMKYEAMPGKARQVLDARKVWQAILESQVETGTPYMCYKDAANLKSNQSHLGTIKSSNLCTEIIEYSSPDEIAVCNLASVALPMYVKVEVIDALGNVVVVAKTLDRRVSGGASTTATAATTLRYSFDHSKLYDVCYQITLNLNKVIDVNYYPVKQAENSNMRHRPIGIGVQGLADAFILMRMPFDSPEAKQLNIEIFETMYFASLTASCDIAARDGAYQSYEGSPMSRGLLQFDLWQQSPPLHSRHDWSALRLKIKQHGVRNSLLLAPMPTASTSQILGNNEAFEPYTSNLYVRRTLAGEFVCVSRHLLKDLIELGIWNESLKNKLIAHKGSVKYIMEIPEAIRSLYKSVWEISQKTIIDMAADRGKFICQSQSLNLHLTDLSFGKLTSMHFYGWKAGLKTGMYYLRTRPATDAIQFTIDPSAVKAANASKLTVMTKSTIAAADVVAPKQSKATTVTSDADAAEHVRSMMLGREGNSPLPSPLGSPVKGAATAAAAAAAEAEALVLLEAVPLELLSAMVANNGEAQVVAAINSISIAAQVIVSPMAVTSNGSSSSSSNGSNGSNGSTSEEDQQRVLLESMTPEERRAHREYLEAKMICSRDNKEACDMCGS